MDGTAKGINGTRSKGKSAPKLRATALVEHQEKVNDAKANVERLHKMRKSPAGEEMIDNLGAASSNAQTLVVLCAAWANLTNSNFSKACQEGKACRQELFDMKEHMNTLQVLALDDKFWESLKPVMTTWGFNMSEPPQSAEEL